MDDTQRKHSGLYWTIIALLAVFVVYPLSVGPALFVLIKLDKTVDLPEFVELAFSIGVVPIAYLIDRFPLIEKVLDPYYDWWQNWANA